MTPEQVKYVQDSDLGNNGIVFYEKLKSFRNAKMVDLGVRHGISSYIMLRDSLQNDNYVTGVDLVNCVHQSVYNHPRYKLILGDSVKTGKEWTGGEIDVLFVDTLHTKEQVLNELEVWMPHVKDNGLVIFHDTHWPKNKFENWKGRNWERPEEAVKAFFNVGDDLTADNEFFTMTAYPESWGMVFIQLKKKSKDFGKNVDWNEIHKFLTL